MGGCQAWGRGGREVGMLSKERRGCWGRSVGTEAVEMDKGARPSNIAAKDGTRTGEGRAGWGNPHETGEPSVALSCP